MKKNFKSEMLGKRNRVFAQKCAKLMNAGGREADGERLGRVVEEVIDGGAPEYYITFESALKGLQRLRHKKVQLPSGGGRRPKIEQWAELQERVDEEMNRKKGIGMEKALSRVLAEGKASKFFISKPTAVRIFRMYVKKEYQLNVK